MESVLLRKSYFIESVKTNIHDDFSFGRLLGEGSYGHVFLATHKLTQVKRAVKQLLKSRIRDPERLANEISIMKECDQPNIVRLYEIYEDDRSVYLVLELCEGGEVFDYVLKKRHLSEQEASEVFVQLLHAVHYLHSHNKD